MSWLKRLSGGPIKDDELAAAAFEVLGELMGEVHAARIVGILALKRSDIFQTANPSFIIRISVGTIAIALRRFADMWTAQLDPILLRDDPSMEGVELHRQVEERGLRALCDQVLAYYSARKLDPQKAMPKIDELLLDGGFASNEAFFLWTREAIAKLEDVRTRVAEKYKLGETASTGEGKD